MYMKVNRKKLKNSIYFFSLEIYIYFTIFIYLGPHGIGTRIVFNDTPLQSGMTVTDEPGYYEDGKFGIRIENVLLVRQVKTPNNFGDRDYLGFEHITLVPIQAKLIDTTLLSPSEYE